jgi:uncharacterized protein (DUF2147 family)
MTQSQRISYLLRGHGKIDLHRGFCRLVKISILVAVGMLCTWPQPLLGQSSDQKSLVTGRWISEDKDLVVEVRMEGDNYGARIVSFVADPDTTPPESRLDTMNPVKALRCRKVLGMEVLQGLRYNEKTHRWEDGHIYDATSGKTWSASAEIGNDGKLHVRGYWCFEWFGKTMVFTRVSQL